MTETITTTTDLNKRKETILKLEGDWSKDSILYGVTITRTPKWAELTEFYRCDPGTTPLPTIRINGPTGDNITKQRPLLKGCLIRQYDDHAILALFINEPATRIYFQTREEADTYARTVRRVIEWILNDPNRKGAGQLSQTFNIEAAP